MITFLKVLAAFVILVLTITFGAVGACFIGVVLGATLPTPEWGVLGPSLLGAGLGLAAGACLVARIFRQSGD